MEKQIKHTILRLKRVFIAFWLLPVLIVILGETGGDWVGLFAGEVRTTYYAESLTILLTAICVPISLKLFAWVLTRKIDKVTIAQALHLYFYWSIIRLMLLVIPVLIGFGVYYLMISNTGVLCAFISLTASLFCMPSEKRLRKELQIDKDEA